MSLRRRFALRWDYRQLRLHGGSDAGYRHRWTFYFLMEVGFWNFTGAGVFGFLINTPVVSYYEIGTLLTVNHGHAAFMGVFGMLGVGLMVYVMREVSPDALWNRVEKYLKVGFWGLNIGLALMIVLSLFPGGLLQVWDVLQNGYWHARSIDYLGGKLPRFIEWIRIVGDTVFIFAGALPIAIALLVSYLAFRRGEGVRPTERLAH